MATENHHNGSEVSGSTTNPAPQNNRTAGGPGRRQVSERWLLIGALAIAFICGWFMRAGRPIPVAEAQQETGRAAQAAQATDQASAAGEEEAIVEGEASEETEEVAEPNEETEQASGDEMDEQAETEDANATESDEAAATPLTEDEIAQLDEQINQLQTELNKLAQEMMSLMFGDPNDPRLVEIEDQAQELTAQYEALQKTRREAVKASQSKPVVPKKPVERTVAPRPSPPAPRQTQATAARSTPAKPKVEQVKEAESVAEEAAQEQSPETTEPEIDQADDGSDPNAIVKLKMQNDMLDLQYLIDYVGKEFKFNFLYPKDVNTIAGKVRLQLYGEIRRRDLMPMLESFLSFYGYALVREDPFIRIIQRDQAHLQTKPRFVLGDEMAELAPGETIVAQIVNIKHVPLATVTSFLSNFTQASTMKQIPGTNSLIITEYGYRLERLLQMITLIDKEGPQARLEPLNVRYIKAAEAEQQIKNLITNLRNVRASVSEDTEPLEPAPDQAAPQPAQPVRPTTGRTPVTRRPTATPRPAAQTQAAQTPLIITEARTNRLLVIGSDEDIQQVQELLVLLDVPDGPPIRLEVVTVMYVEAKTVVGQIENLVKKLNPEEAPEVGGDAGSPEPTPAPTPDRPQTPQPPRRTVPQRRGTTPAAAAEQAGAYMQVDERTNRIFLVGSEDQIKQVQDLLGLLDVPDVVEIKLDIMAVSYLAVTDVTRQLTDLIKALNQEAIEDDSRSMRSNRTAGGRTPPSRPTPAPATSEGTTAAGASDAVEGPPTAAAKAASKGPYLLGDERTNRLFVVGTAEQLKQVRDLLGLLDIPSRPHIELVPVFVEHVLASDLAEQISALMQDLYQDELAPGGAGSENLPTTQRRTTQPQPSLRSRRTTSSSRGGGESSAGPVKVSDTGPFIHIDERTNRMLVIGTAEQFAQVQKLQALLDVPPHEYEQLVLKVYQPQYVEAEEVRRILEDLGIIRTERELTARDRAEQRNRNLTGQGQDEPQRPRPPIVGADAEAAPTPTPSGGDENLPEGPTLLPGEEEMEVRVAVQESTNKLFVLGTQRQHADIDEVMKHVDLERPTQGTIRIYPLENQKPDFVADALKELLDAAREVQTGGDQVERLPGQPGAPVVVSLYQGEGEGGGLYAVAVSASDQEHREIETIIKQLDKRLPQVLVEATLIQVSEDDNTLLGISLKGEAVVTGDPTNPRRISGLSPFNIVDPTSAIPVGATAAFFDDDQVYATLNALQTTGNSRVISKPRILVNDNEEGSIKSAREEQTTVTTLPPGSDTPVISVGSPVEAGTELKIIPHIGDLSRKALQLEITLDVDNFVGEGSGSIPPPRATNNITTRVTVPEGKTLVLGGLIRVTDEISVNKVPLLGDIPLLGVLFRSTNRTKDRGVLYVFVKAHIVGREGTEDQADFQDLIDLSEEAKEKLRRTEELYRKQSMIPGLKDEDREKTSVLDDLE